MSRKITALGLIGVFLFIHAVKILHTHPAINYSKHDTSVSAFCFICDYHFVKDGEEPAENEISIVITRSWFTYPFIVEASYTPPFHFATASRGPPFMI